jgi:hypothetical protein
LGVNNQEIADIPKVSPCGVSFKVFGSELMGYVHRQNTTEDSSPHD